MFGASKQHATAFAAWARTPSPGTMAPSERCGSRELDVAHFALPHPTSDGHHAHQTASVRWRKGFVTRDEKSTNAALRQFRSPGVQMTIRNGAVH
jgi:hypothetical protein